MTGLVLLLLLGLAAWVVGATFAWGLVAGGNRKPSPTPIRPVRTSPAADVEVYVPPDVTYSVAVAEPRTTEATTLAALRQSVWEASQHRDPAALREYVESVLREIETDEP